MTARRRNLVAASFGAVIVVVFAAVAAAVAPYLLPDTTVDTDIAAIVAAGIFAGSYLALAVGRVPGLSIDRAGIALVGACLMVATGILTPEEAYRAVNLDTLTLLLGVMIVAANLRLSGFFTLANTWLMRVARRPVTLLAADRGDFGRVLGVSGQRYDLLDPIAAGIGDDAWPRAEADTLPSCHGNGV